MSASVTAMSASVTATNSSVTAADAAACSSRSFEVQLLAGRMEACAEQVDAVQARLAQLQLMDWQSPAGLAYRSSLRVQAVALCRAREGVLVAALALRRHSVRVAESALPAAGGY
ncbi:hypothetical protein [Arthrobacter sp. AFG20]|uniref:hypothetical protein n=1 Tax=Arthrobacter sp. AFG20 TaxID=1688671 RepID=UPI0021559D04|nr:hypothetical protein [Arthrobacter sp. AFG20]